MQVCFVQGSFISLLCKRFMLIVCICLPGLINGSTGRIFKIIYRPNRHPPMLPDLLLAEFPQYLGPSFLDNHDHIVPLTPFTHTWVTKEKKNYARTQFPVLPGDSFSVHGAQGKTEAKTICNLGGMFAHFYLNDHIFLYIILSSRSGELVCRIGIRSIVTCEKNHRFGSWSNAKFWQVGQHWKVCSVQSKTERGQTNWRVREENHCFD